MLVKKISNEEFTSFANKFYLKSIYQTSEYSFVMTKQNSNCLFVGLIDNNNIIGATFIYIQELNGFYYAYAPHGFLIDYSNYKILSTFTVGVKKILRKMKVIGIKLNPLIIKKEYNSKKQVIYNNPDYDKIYDNLKKLGYYHLGYNNLFESLKPRFYASIDLDKNLYDIFKYDIKDEFKTKIKSANNNGIRIFKGSNSSLKYIYEETKKKYPRDLKYYQDCYYFFEQKNMIEYYYAKIDVNNFLKSQQLKYQELYDKSEKYNRDFLLKSKSNSSKLLAKKIFLENEVNIAHSNLVNATNIINLNPEGVVIATMITIKYGDTVYVLMDSYDERFKKYNAKHLLIWKLIEKYSKEGYKKFNLGGLPNINEKSVYDGLVQFKLNFGANTTEYAGDFELITNNSLYFLYRNASPLRKMLKK